MRLRRSSLFAALLLAFLLLPAHAFGADPCQNPSPRPVTGNAANTCQNVPEASSALIYAGVGVAVVALFVGVGAWRRRRGRSLTALDH